MILSARDVIAGLEQTKADIRKLLTEACTELMVAKSMMPWTPEANAVMEKLHDLIHEARRTAGERNV